MNRLLFQHFLNSFFASDLVARGGDLRSFFVMVAAVCAAPGLLVAFYSAPVAGGFDMTPMTTVFTTLSMVLMGLVTVLAWEQLFPDRIDFMVSRPLPVPARSVFLAKLGALGAFLCCFAFTINAFSSTLLPVLGSSQKEGGALHAFRIMAAGATAAVSAAAWMFCALIMLQGALLAAGGPRALRRAGPPLQLAVMAVLLTALALLPNLFHASLVAELASSPYANWLPPFWFVGFNKLLAGGARGAWPGLGMRGVYALLLTFSSALLLYALGYRRLLRETLGAEPSAMRRRGPAWVGWLGRRPRERAVLRFATLTLARSSRHRLLLSVWLALAAAIILQSGVALAWRHGAATATTLEAVLALPLVVTFLAMLGLRHVFGVPIDMPANWVFRLTDTPLQAERFAVARKLLLAYGAAPAVLLSLPLTEAALGWGHALIHGAVAAALAVLLAEILMFRNRKLPFTCSYLPGEGNVSKLGQIAVVLFGFTVFVFTTAGVERRLWAHPMRLAGALAAVAAVAAGLGWERRRWYAGGVRCQLDDEPEPLVMPLFSRD